MNDLMIKRFKVIADYPQPPFNEDGNEHKFIEGDILMYLKVNNGMTFRRVGRCGYMSVGVPCIKNPEKFPKIFRELQWYENREENEMPEYLKNIADNRIFKPAYFGKDREYFTPLPNENHQWLTKDFIPATLEEYNDYINQNKETK